MPTNSKSRRSLSSQKKRSSSSPHPLLFVSLGIFVYLLWLHTHLIIESNVAQGDAIVRTNDRPIPKKPSKTKQKSFDLPKLVDFLTASFTDEANRPSDKQRDFQLSFRAKEPNSTCTCDVVSMDCLDAISCMKDMHDPHNRHALAWMGMELRKVIKAMSEFENKKGFAWHFVPLGKLLQYNTMSAWTLWRTSNALPEYDPLVKNLFVKPELYPDCVKDNGKTVKVKRKGAACFYRTAKYPEDTAGAIIEDKAKQWYNTTIGGDKDVLQRIRRTLIGFLQNHRVIPGFSTQPTTYEAYFSPLGNLMMFSHLTRIMFNRRPFLDKIYREKVTSLDMPGFKDPSPNQTNADREPFVVSLHMRRGDSCGDPNPRNYEREASALRSRAQTGGDRKCYATQVYVDQIFRIRKMVPMTRPLHVYLGTDDPGDILLEILNRPYSASELERSGQNTFGNILGVDRWHYLNYTRDHFNYMHKAESIEADENTENQPILGETAVADLWLLSHGHAFVGHLGSRFGKVAWLLATARRNSFVPFFSVDGHSFCCEIDENCGKIKPYITVENCLSYGHEYLDLDHANYWEEGSVARKKYFLDKHDWENEVQDEGNDDERKVEDISHKKIFSVKDEADNVEEEFSVMEKEDSVDEESTQIEAEVDDDTRVGVDSVSEDEEEGDDDASTSTKAPDGGNQDKVEQNKDNSEEGDDDESSEAQESGNENKDEQQSEHSGVV